MTSPTDGLALQIEGWLAEQVTALDLDHRSGPGKPRVLPALLLWTGLVVCVLRGMCSQAAPWRLLAQRGLWSFPRIPISDDAVRVRLARDGTGPMERLFAQVTTLLAQRIAPFVETKLAAFATDILVIDEITLDTLARLLPALRDLPAGDPGLLAGTLAALVAVRRQQWRRILYRDDTLQNEKVAARSLVEGLATGTLLLCDLGSVGFKWFDELTDAGFFWLSRLRSKTSYELIETLYEQGETLDAIVWLGKHRSDRAKHAVRLIQFSGNGRLYRSITYRGSRRSLGDPLGMLDPAQLRMREAAQLSARRWDIELAISILKTELRLHLIWAAKPVVIQQQIWAVLIIHQIFAAFRMEIAGRAEVELFDVSLPLLIEDFPHFARAGTDPIELLVECGRELGSIRPSSRHETQAPVIPLSDYHAPTPDLVLERKPRYAERRCERKAS